MIVEDRSDILFEISGSMLEDIVDYAKQEMTVLDLKNILADCLLANTEEKIEVKDVCGLFLTEGSKEEQLEHLRNTILYLAAVIFQMGVR